MNPYEEGRKACAEGTHRSMCPYHWKGTQVPARREWLRGYADQAREEADDAVSRLT